MNIANLIDAMVRQTSVLLAQLATQGGGRAQLANTANQVLERLRSSIRAMAARYPTRTPRDGRPRCSTTIRPWSARCAPKRVAVHNRDAVAPALTERFGQNVLTDALEENDDDAQ